jgi:hypothetical protein
MLRLVPSEIKNGQHRQTDGFFAVDRRTWERVCELGLNRAVAYLVLARGTGKTNRETAWSVMAIENYTGISRGRAHNAVSALVKDGVVRKLREGTRPKYELVPWHLLPANDTRPVADAEESVIKKVVLTKEIPVSQQGTLKRLLKKGWLIDDGNGRYKIAPRPGADPDRIWLPNTLVTSAAAETAPIELVRQGQDVMTLRLLVDLYHAQNLRDDGGISRKITWEEYERVKVGQQGPFDVWGFESVSLYVNWVGPACLPPAGRANRCGGESWRKSIGRLLPAVVSKLLPTVTWRIGGQ